MISPRCVIFSSGTIYSKQNITQGCFVPSLVNIGPVVLEVLISSMYSRDSFIVSPLSKNIGVAFWTNLIPLYRKNTLYFVWLLCPNILEKKIVWISSIFFSLYFIIISPWEKAQTFICDNDCFVLSWVETGPVFLEKNIWKWRQCIFAIFVIIVSFEKDFPLHFKKAWILFSDGCFFTILIEID